MESNEYRLALQKQKAEQTLASKRLKQESKQKLFIKNIKPSRQFISKEGMMLGELFGQGGKAMFGSNQPVVDMNGGINHGEGLITNKQDSEETGSYFGI